MSKELPIDATSGWSRLAFNLLLMLGGPVLFLAGIIMADQDRANATLWITAGLSGALSGLLGLILMLGHFSLQPNEARLLILFGEYRGTVRRSGFYWANPFYARTRARLPMTSADPAKVGAHPLGRALNSKISLRANNFNSPTLKVNDKRGNPIEIAAVVVWRVEDTARAAFDVQDYESYVQIQTESAIRHIASLFAYDHGEEDEPTLRGSGDDVSTALRTELEARLEKAGLAVDEARLTHLAYAPEIAQAMLRRQQAEAVIAARQKIVIGAVSMVEMALKHLTDKHLVELDEERKAAMVGNLLVVLCGESEAQPIINTGTLYH